MLFHHSFSLGAHVTLTLALLAGMFAAVPISAVFAATLIVPDNYRTIQAAINAASPGDIILVRAGTYAENLTLNKSVILSAASYDRGDPTHNTTIINGRSSTPTIRIPPGVSPMPTIRGFVVKNGLDGIKTSSEAIIEYNFFIASTDQLDYSAGSGGINRSNVYFNSQDDAIDLDDMNRPLLIENNLMMYSRDDGIEVRLQDASTPSQPITITIRNNTIIGCHEDGIQFIDYGQAVDSKRNFMVSGNLIANCHFAGIGLMGNANSVEDYSGANIIETIWVYNNTIYGNDYGISGGDNLITINNIIANSTSKGVWQVQGSGGAGSIVAYTMFYNNGIDADQSTLGGGNRFGQNPLFASAPNPGPDGVWNTADDDFRGLALQGGSPAIDTGYDPSCPTVDLRGVLRPQGAHCDIGAYEFQIASSIFEDVTANYWAWNFIERLYSAGITDGCAINPLRYCPETRVTRAQMAIFLERGIHGSSYTPPAVGGSTGFGDVSPTYWAAAWIKQLAAEGITGGCGSGRYCPEVPVTRAQMAVFLLRSKHGASYSPPAVRASTGFGDVPTNYWAAAWIKQLVAEGITAGCGNGNYCPEAPVTRAQMAVFLVRTFNLP